jgi:hypothetical protein
MQYMIKENQKEHVAYNQKEIIDPIPDRMQFPFPGNGNYFHYKSQNQENRKYPVRGRPFQPETSQAESGTQ